MRWWSGPSAPSATSRDGDRGEGRTGAARDAPHPRHDEPVPGSRRRSRCQAIWTNKLRSFLTVLGNIVAVTSIIAVVSLIQGMNALRHRHASSPDVGADNFTIQRMPVVRTEADEERVRNNPRITTDGRGCGPAVQRQRRGGRGAGLLGRERQLRRRAARGRAGPRRVARLRLFLDVRRRARPADQPGRNRRATAPSRSWAGTPPTSCSARPHPLDKIDQDRRRCTSAWSASARRRDRSSATRRTISRSSRSARSSKLFGSRPFGLQLLVKPTIPELVKAAMDDATRGAAHRAPAAAERAGQLRDVHVRHAPRASTHAPRAASSPCWSASSRCRWSSAASSS